jgi:hypothetical protein
MIAPIRTNAPDDQVKTGQGVFLAMLPRIRRQAHRAFRHLDSELRDELVAEAVAFAFCAFVDLARQGRLSIAYPTPLADYAIRRVCSGRKAACRMNRNDVMSHYARRSNGLSIKRLDRRDDVSGQWTQILVEDRRSGPAETAAARIDVSAWLRTLSKRDRRIAKALALGEGNSAVAKQFGLSCGRISQLRAWFRSAWEQFQGGNQLAGCAI